MLSVNDVYADLEADRASRESEIRLIENFLSSATDEHNRSMLKRSLILLTYAHLEGFCRFSLTAYVSAINAMGLSCGDASAAIAAAGFSKIFSRFTDIRQKHAFFRDKLPDDEKLHRTAREQEFVRDFDRARALPVAISDEIIDTKSNVDMTILKKLLFQLGLPFDPVDKYRSDIGRLVGVRNAIAHGDRLKVPRDHELKEYIRAAMSVMDFLQGEVFKALSENRYLKDADMPKEYMETRTD